MELTFIVWNTQRKSLYREVTDIAHELNPEFLVLIENDADPSQLIAQIAVKTGKQYYYYPNIQRFKNGHLYSTYELDSITVLLEHSRYSIREIKIKNVLFNLIIVHLPSKNNLGNPVDQDAVCVQLTEDITFIENQYKHQRSIIVGDFNMNPFENGLVNAKGLHSIMDKQIAKTKNRSIYDRSYEYFYNPMWSFFGDLGKGNLNGTYYYNSSTYSNFFWNMYDQVLVRPDLLDNFDDNDLAIIDNINGLSLTKQVNSTTRINDLISDHLPITFKLKFQ